MSDEIFQKIKSGVELLKENGVSTIDDVYFVEGAKAEQVSHPQKYHLHHRSYY